MTHAQRQHALAVMTYLYEHRAVFDYPPGDQRSNRDGFSWQLAEQQMAHYIAGGGRPCMDCSEAGSWVWKCVGAWHHPVPGYTGTHLEWILPHYTDPHAAGVAAMVVFGGGTGEHEGLVMTPDPQHGNPLIWGHGEAGVDILPLSQLTAYFERNGHPGVRFLSAAKQ